MSPSPMMISSEPGDDPRDPALNREQPVGRPVAVAHAAAGTFSRRGARRLRAFGSTIPARKCPV